MTSNAVKGPPIQCDLCKVKLPDTEEFILHCRKNPIHLELQTKFTDETFDFLFKENCLEDLSDT